MLLVVSACGAAVCPQLGCFQNSPTIVPPPRMTSTEVNRPGAPIYLDGSLSSSATQVVSKAPAPQDAQPPSTARNPKPSGPATFDFTPNTKPRAWKFIVLHHSATPRGTVAQIDDAHRQRVDSQGNPWLGIGYHFVIGNGQGMPDGRIEATFRWRDQIQGAHAGIRQYNEQGIGVCLIGDFTKTAPTTAQITAAQALVAWLQAQYDIPLTAVLKHSDLVATECPGDHFPLDSILHPERFP